MRLLLKISSPRLMQSENAWITDDLKYECMKVWFAEDPLIGKKPVWLNADGHGSNLSLRKPTVPVAVTDDAPVELELPDYVAALCRRNKVGLMITAAHTTHLGLQQLDMKDGLIQRAMRCFDKLMIRQCQAALTSTRGMYKGRISVAEVVSIAEIAFFEEASCPAKAIRDSKRAGYYVDGELCWNPVLTLNLAKLNPATAFGARPVTSDQLDGEAARVARGAELMEEELRAVGAAFLVGTAAPVPRPLARVPRVGRKSRSKYGVVVTEKDWELSLGDDDAAVAAAAKKLTDKAAKVASRWELRRPGIRTVETKLAAKVSPSKLQVARLQDFIYGRTGRNAKAKSNKEGAITTEARDILRRELPLLLPATPTKTPEADSDNESVFDDLIDESLGEGSADPLAEPSYAEEPPAAAATPPVAPEPEQAVTVTTTTATTRAERAKAAERATNARVSAYMSEIVANDRLGPLPVAKTAAEEAEAKKKVGPFI
jgi:hypothetical protein